MPNIKTKEMKKDIKNIDKSVYLKNMKNIFIGTIEKAEETQRPNSDTPNTYATDSISAKAKEFSNTAAKKVEHFGRQSLKKALNSPQKTKTDAVNIKQRVHNTTKSIKTKQTIKTENKARSAGKTAVNTVKTSKQTAQASAKTAQTTMKASRNAAQTARTTAKAAANTAEATVKAVEAAVKTTVSAGKGLVALIAAGGWVAVIIILVICIVGISISSPFGIFFSSDTADSDNMTIASVIELINKDFNAKIDRIITKIPHDEVDGITTPQNWKEVLAVYAVKYSANPDNPVDVATINNQKLQAIKSVFWDMNKITFAVETIKSETVKEAINTSTQQNLKTILHITVKKKGYSEMAAQYTFNSEQYKQLNELMSDNFNNIWSELLK